MEPTGALSPRQSWMCDCITYCFRHIPLDRSDVQRSVNNPDNWTILNSFLCNEESPNRIFIFHVVPEDGTAAANGAQQQNSQRGRGNRNSQPQILQISTGEQGVAFPSTDTKWCYFVRTTHQVNLAEPSDASVLFGESFGETLSSIELTLNQAYRPLLVSDESLGKAGAKQFEEYVGELDHFTQELTEAIKSMEHGIKLRQPPPEMVHGSAVSSHGHMSQNTSVVSVCEDLLDDWCRIIESYIDAEQGNSGGNGMHGSGYVGSSSHSAQDGDPMSEIEYWRTRMATLTSILEQLKMKECKFVIGVLSQVTRNGQDASRNAVFVLLRKWKQVDLKITEAANEAKDNVKYLVTLEKFLQPLYSSDPTAIIDTLPALLNSIKIIHTIARHYNTPERMSNLLAKITNQLITSCKTHILNGEKPEDLWDRDPTELAKRLEDCITLKDAYVEQYRLVKEKLAQMPRGKQFSFDENLIFGKFELFCRRLTKMIDAFSTIYQFSALSTSKLEGIEPILSEFQTIVQDFRSKQRDLLDYAQNRFDRDYVEFTLRIGDLEQNMLAFIDDSFTEISSIDNSLELLTKFRSVFQRENLKNSLDSKFNVIFQVYGQELEQVQSLYEKHKQNPPIARNMPPVAGNILWSRLLLNRIEGPMRTFEANQNILSSKDAKRIIKQYNKIVRTLVAFEFLWFQAWVQAIDTAKAGLQATLIIRHPDDSMLYVNFDHEILQLIREAKCLERMRIEIPESAKIVLLQEEKFKSFYNDLRHALAEYDDIVSYVIPVTAILLRPHFDDMEYKLRPGMVTLTWTSMNIRAYINHVQDGLHRLGQLVKSINDIIENRIEKHLRIVSRTMLVNLPQDKSFTMEEFLTAQREHIDRQAKMLQAKNDEIERSVNDLIAVVESYCQDNHIEKVKEEEMNKIKHHYNHFFYQALLYCTKNALTSLKKRIGSTQSQRTKTLARAGSGGIGPAGGDADGAGDATSRGGPGAGGGGARASVPGAGAGGGGSVEAVNTPFFEVDVELSPPRIVLSPGLDEIQHCINEAAKMVIKSSEHLYDWGQDDGRLDEEKETFFDMITKDIEVVRVILLLTGSVQGAKKTVDDYLADYTKYSWLWKQSIEDEYAKFAKQDPSLEDYEQELKRFSKIEQELQLMPLRYDVGCVALNLENLQVQIVATCNAWKMRYAEKLHANAVGEMNALNEYVRSTSTKLSKKVVDLDSLRFMMNLLKELRFRESVVLTQIQNLMDTFAMLDYYMPEGFVSKEEMDSRSILRSNWKKLMEKAGGRTLELSQTQAGFKRKLLKDIKEFVVDVQTFRKEFERHGPMVQGIKPEDAIERLNRFKEELKIRERKQDLYCGGEELFRLPITEYPELEQTKKDMKICSELFSLYSDVKDSLAEWNDMPWITTLENIDFMTDKMDSYATRCKKMPKRLREWGAYLQLRKSIDDFLTVLPLLQDLSKPSIRDRHWMKVMEIAKSDIDITEMGTNFKLQMLIDLNLFEFKEEIEEITDSADKELKIETSLEEITEKWTEEKFNFQSWKTRQNVSVLAGTPLMLEELEEAQMILQTMLTMRNVEPFRDRAQELLQILYESSDILERWIKVQTLWCSLESVFTGGDIAKQMPVEAKKFQKIDKEWVKIMERAEATLLVLECCSNDMLKTSLPVMYNELEKCQKSLEGYLEQKRNKFPRFYFVSNNGLLMILSQGSDPTSMNQYYEKVFDSIDKVEHNKRDKTIIEELKGYTTVPFSTPVRAVGNIEDWLTSLLGEMRKTMKNICRDGAMDIMVMQPSLTRDSLRAFVDSYIAQFALLGIQLLWTEACQTSIENYSKSKKAIAECARKQDELLAWMSSWCLEDLGPKANRKKIETLVTVHLHQRDVTWELKNLAAQRIFTGDVNDFEWLKQARFYWRPSQGDEVNNDGACVIAITDVDFNYQYEFLGAKERLVITPLTDRCYITLSQALGMCFGGAPAGPAGTGKTETVKDLGSTLGLYVVVTNCTDQMKHTDCAKIFKGLCQAGLWGCFDEFNRILLPVLSVVAQQVLAIQNAKKGALPFLQFPGDPQNILLNPVCGFFITMNPGYAGRQELPENLKALFRGVSMMVPNFETIIKVKLCSVGYHEYSLLATKFFQLYDTCKQQLSKQKHYDWGLRNILAVLRSGGAIKRENLDKPEQVLMYQTLRDMNLSKMVAQDVPLFLSLLADLFPAFSSPQKAVYSELMEALEKKIAAAGLVMHESWVSKVIQLYETTLVRHGIMLVGPSGGGKSKIFKILMDALQVTRGVNYREIRINPKAMRAQELYGEEDKISGEWTTGVFAAAWAKANERTARTNTWIIMDGPVDAIWIEDLNTVLDDNKLLTLANGDRIPMTDNVKLMFEVETLVNASPATVSRAGIIFVSETDLDWTPVVEAWVRTRPPTEQEIFRGLFEKYLGTCQPNDPGEAFNFINRQTKTVMPYSRVGAVARIYNILTGLLEPTLKCPFKMDVVTGKNMNLGDGSDFQCVQLSPDPTTMAAQLERMFLYAMAWGMGGLTESEDRTKFDDFLRQIDGTHMPPDSAPGNESLTVYEYYIDQSANWVFVKPPIWKYPETEKLDFSNLLVPTMDSTRALYLMALYHKQKIPALVVGGAGTAKTSTILMFFATMNASMLVKQLNFSSATTPFIFQSSIEVELEKRGGKNFGPPGGKRMTFFIDDLSMPDVNKWGDQPTLEMVRILVESGGFPFLDKDKRGDMKSCEDLQYVAAMAHPGGGKNDIPSRLRRHFGVFNMVLPSIVSINNIYGQMLDGRFPRAEFDRDTGEVVSKLTSCTIELWRKMKASMLPTPTKFHYSFNLRELSRVFQGILLTPKETVQSGGGIRVERGQDAGVPAAVFLVKLWQHECERVFCDKLTNLKDKATYKSYMKRVTEHAFGGDLAEQYMTSSLHLVSCLREDVYDDDDILVNLAPKIYESGGTLEDVRQRVTHFSHKYNEEFPQKMMSLVLFDDALNYLTRISRLIEMPRGSALLVGVGGSGKQSLTKLAAYMSRAELFEITLTKTYNISSLMEDLKSLYDIAGHQRKQTVFLFTESQIKDEQFLEYLNSVLTTGEVPGLFTKEELLSVTADLRNAFVKERPELDESPENLRQFFIDNVRDNLHVVMCMSPLNPLFPVRARKFPGLISGPTINWFLTWPQEALVEVARGFIGPFAALECAPAEKEGLIHHMGNCHHMVHSVCEEYFGKMRRVVYQTPKSYLSFLKMYRTLYEKKLKEIKVKETRVKLGLRKLNQGAEDVEGMKVVLAEEKVKLERKTEETEKMIKNLETSKADANKEEQQVTEIKRRCEEDAARIGVDKKACEEDLAKAQPFVDQANEAILSIKPSHINEVKKLPKPADIIKLIFDCCLILFMEPTLPVRSANPPLSIKREEIQFFESSYDPYGVRMLSDPGFLNRLRDFGKEDSGKDKINEETIELLQPYMEIENWDRTVARNASQAAEGIFTWVCAMNSYHGASKMIQPKLEALKVAEGQMEAANKALKQAEDNLKICQDRLAELQEMFDNNLAEKRRIEEGANNLARKMQQAADLINGLSNERNRWSDDAQNFADLKRRLVGDCVVTAGFLSYCGPFNQEFRRYIIKDKFIGGCIQRKVPVTENLDVISFTVDIGTIGDWNIEGLPTDSLSIQNGILITNSSRYPLLIDPQGQALFWIKNRESERLPPYGTTTLNNPKIRDQLEYAMAEGKALIVTNIEEEVDPLLDPVLEKEFIKRGQRLYVNVSDRMMEVHNDFFMYFITRLPNPHFSPELQAKTSVVDFTVTQKGLEEQLLGRVIGREQKALEEQLSQVLQEKNQATKALMTLDNSLLERLTSNSGNLLEDEELISVLATTKKKAAEVNVKLVSAEETKTNIDEKRDQFRPVATRGSVLYFTIVEMAMVNTMYQISLDQFIEIFIRSMEIAEKATLASKRVTNIIETMTYVAYRYINRGIYEKDKLTFKLLTTMKILVTAKLLHQQDVVLFLRGGAALDINNLPEADRKQRSLQWLNDDDAWLNIVELSRKNKFYKDLKNDLARSEAMWQRWYEDSEPEMAGIPDYESRFAEHRDIAPFYKLLLIRAMRMDRTILVVKEFIASTEFISRDNIQLPVMGPKYVEPVTDTIENIYEESVATTPIIFLLSQGADPTDSIDLLARKRKLPSPAVVSMGEGQEPVAQEAIIAGAQNGTWVLLQNCELGLELMDTMEDFLAKQFEGCDPGFRLFLTALPHPQFPLALLQMSTKVTNEPPAGLKAGMLRSYNTMVDQDRLERVETREWRQLLFVLCFLHSIALERRKFGSLGWCIPYEYNTGDLAACITFLEKHLYNGPISWPTVRYMISEVQYGGKITDDLDRRLFALYASAWLNEDALREAFSFNPLKPIFYIPNDFNYRVPNSESIVDYRNYCMEIPEIDSPEIFGLHPNADLTFRKQEVNNLLQIVNETQPKGGGSGGGGSRESDVQMKAAEYLDRLPVDFVEDEYRIQLDRHGGLAMPMNIFLYQEIQQLQKVIGTVRFTLQQLQLALNGEVVMTEYLTDALNAIYDARPPKMWVYTVSGDEFSWDLQSLGLWFASLQQRYDQNCDWLDRGWLISYWLTGFFNPQGLLTAMMQEVTRKHKADKWSLDDMVYHTEVTTYERTEQIRNREKEGIFVHGLFMDGASWSIRHSHVVESEPKRLFMALPVLYVTGLNSATERQRRKDLFEDKGPYAAPCYKYPKRTDRFLIFMVNLKCGNDSTPQHWGLRGLALLCNTDN